MDISIQVALIGLGGTLIGGLISCGTTCFLDLAKFKRDEKLYLKKKREETYKNMLNLVYIDRQEKNDPFSATTYNSEVSKKLKDLYADINMYASYEIRNIYIEVIKSDLNEEYKLINAIRKELGIKDNE